MENDSHRLQIQKRLCERLEMITPANGYCHDLTGKVRRGVLKLDDLNMPELPLLSLLEAVEPGQLTYPESGGNSQAEEWKLLLSGWVDTNGRHPTDAAHALLADVKAVLAPIRQHPGRPLTTDSLFALGGLIERLEIGGGICRPPDPLSPTSYFLLPLKVTFIETLKPRSTTHD